MKQVFNFESGELLLFDKPKGWTSFDVVAKVRNLIGGAKVGHAGTLDPLATGLLILCTGKMTKDIQVIQDADKEYIADVRLGATTPSYDAEFPPEHLTPADHITEADLQSALLSFTGAIEQLPPAFSAVKIDGKRAYNLARKGKPVETRPRTVTIHAIELISMEPATDRQIQLLLRIACTKGTYVRTIAHDLGQLLGVGGYLTDLRRTAIGAHQVKDAWTVEAFQAVVRPPAAPI